MDPIEIGASIIQSLPAIERHLSSPTEPVIMTVTQFVSGVAKNITPNIATLEGTLRATSIEHKNKVKQYFEKLVKNIAETYGATVDLELTDLYPSTINTTNETQLVISTAQEMLGKNRVHYKNVPARAAEDFSIFLQHVPGCYFFIGNGINSAACHSSAYNFNDAALPVAAQLFSAVALNFLRKNP